LYVQRDSLVKMFGLCALQLAVCLVIAGVVHSFLLDLDESAESAPPASGGHEHHEPYLPVGKVIPLPEGAPPLLVAGYWGLSLLNLVLIMILWNYRSSHPCNYVTLALLTLSMGCFWGVSSSHFAFAEHMLFLAHMVVTLGVASLVCLCLRYQEKCFQHVVSSALAALCFGWTLGLALAYIYSELALDSWGVARPWAAAGLSMAALFFIFLYMLHSLVHGATDDLIGLVGGMDASIMAIISLPYLLLLLACCVPSALQWVQHEPTAPAVPATSRAERPANP
ncbi:VDE1, partial [Symbiodinium pilosum]